MAACCLGIVLVIVCWTQIVQADIYKWEYIYPGDPSQGKQQSTDLITSKDAVPGANFYNNSLTKAYLIDVDLSGATMEFANLTDADLSNATLVGTDFDRSNLTGATFTGADIRHARFWETTNKGFTAGQLYATASYQSNDLTGVDLSSNNLSGWNFANRNLTHASFRRSDLANADFAGAVITGSNLSEVTSRGFTYAMLQSTASYQNGDLRDVLLAGNDLSGWQFAGMNLEGAVFSVSQLTLTDFSGANIRDGFFHGVTSNGFLPSQLYATASYQTHSLGAIDLSSNDLTEWSFVGQDLTGASFESSNLTNTDFSGAYVRSADFQESNLSEAQLASTKSYQERSLQQINFDFNDLSGWNLTGQDLTGVSFYSTQLAGADFTGAFVRGVRLGEYISAEQLYSTASYQAKDLRDLYFEFVDISGWNLAGQDLSEGSIAAMMTNTNFWSANLQNTHFFWSGPFNLSGTDFTGADARGSQLPVFEEMIMVNFIRPDGTIQNLDLTFENRLLIRDHDGRDSEYHPVEPTDVLIAGGLTMNSSSTLELRFDADEWNSTISFEEGISVALDGTLELTFADDVNIMSQVGRTLDLFDWTGVTPTGLFTVASDYIWDLSELYTTGEVTLTGVTTLSGDIDGDGDVDGRDFLALQRDSSLGSMTAWQANYGDSVSGMANFVPVPEPGSGVLGVIALAVGMRMRRL